MSKALWSCLLIAVSLGLVFLGLFVERSIWAALNPALQGPFHALPLVHLLAWVWVGSLPALAFFVWVADRIGNAFVTIVFGLMGVVLAITLSSAEVPNPWKRDLIPWVLPHYCAKEALGKPAPQGGQHIAGKILADDPNITRLPSGRKLKTTQNIPEEVLFPPPPPTPGRILLVFSICAGLALFGLGIADSGRDRA